MNKLLFLLVFTFSTSIFAQSSEFEKGYKEGLRVGSIQTGKVVMTFGFGNSYRENSCINDLRGLCRGKLTQVQSQLVPYKSGSSQVACSALCNEY